MNNRILGALSAIPIWLTTVLGALSIATSPIFQLVLWAVGIILTTWAATRLWNLSHDVLSRAVSALVIVVTWGGLLIGTFLGELSSIEYMILGLAGLLFITLNGVFLYRTQ